ncbi:MAG: hypothetical protein GY928_17050 [Colwellia sp.]|nr:hypothetical protein [Colwellia sp.]
MEFIKNSYMDNAKDVPVDWNNVDWYHMPFEERSEYLNRWRTENAVVMETPAYRLLCFRGGYGDAIIIDPPSSGHDSHLADWDKDQSLVQCALDNTNLPVYVIDYKGYDVSQGKETYDDIVNHVIKAIEWTATKKAHLVSLCQSGPVGSIIAAMRPELIASLTVAGSPINPHACESILQKAIDQPMHMYEAAVGDKGYMAGELMLYCWMSSNNIMHYINRWKKQNLCDYRSQRFGAWYYDHTLNLGGDWYLTAVEKIFKNNDLFEGRFTFEGDTVDLTNIKCPVNSVYGTKDNISPKGHAIALGEKVSGHYVYKAEGGHLGCFQGRKSIANVWPKLFNTLPKACEPTKPEVVVADGSFIYDGVVIGDGAKVFKASFVYAGSVLGMNSVVKNACIVNPRGIVKEGEVVPTGGEK